LLLLALSLVLVLLSQCDTFIHTYIHASTALVLQAEVSPALLIKDRRKFHIRSYVVVVERPQLDNLVEVFVYNRHEVRIAGVPVPTNGADERDPVVHITNGAMSNNTERVLLRNVDELMDRNLHRTLDVFLAETFGKQLLPEMARRIKYNASQGGGGGVDLPGVEKFALAGLDLMITEKGRLYLLEVNVNPIAPAEATVDNVFREHLQGLIRDLIDLVAGKAVENFVSAQAILVREGLVEAAS
jgi:Tubulin-tyrosine ligase family